MKKTVTVTDEIIIVTVLDPNDMLFASIKNVVAQQDESPKTVITVSEFPSTTPPHIPRVVFVESELKETQGEGGRPKSRKNGMKAK